MITELPQDWGNRFGVHVCLYKVQNFVHTRSQEIGAVSPQETEPDISVSVQESLVEAWVNCGLLQSPGTEYNSVCTSPFEGGWPQAKLQGGNTAPPMSRKLD